MCCVPRKPSYLIPEDASEAQLQAANLEDPYETRNGVTMCPNCSNLFALGLFYFEGDGTLWISNALKTHSKWAARVGTKILRTTKRAWVENWPSERIIAFRRAFCEEAQKEATSGR